MTKRSEPTPVVLGMHANDTLNVFVRNEDGALTQAARIMTHNGVDPSAMTAVMADLADTFGWRDIAAGPLEVPQSSRELPRAGVTPVAPVKIVNPPKGSRTRRSAADMDRQRQTALQLLRAVTSAHPWSTSVVQAKVYEALRLPNEHPDSNLRRQLLELHEQGQIGRTDVGRPNGAPAYVWHRV